MNGGPARLDFVDGQQSANITVTINDDDVPENTEHFEIGLTVQNAVGNGGVLVKHPDRSYIAIRSNDDANGVFQFDAPQSTYVVMREADTTGDLIWFDLIWFDLIWFWFDLIFILILISKNIYL